MEGGDSMQGVCVLVQCASRGTVAGQPLEKSSSYSAMNKYDMTCTVDLSILYAL
jgi:hypothetical protein